MQIKLTEAVDGLVHQLTATGAPGAGKTFLLDKIADGCTAWGFSVLSIAGAGEKLMLKGSRRTPTTILDLVERSAAAWGFVTILPAGQATGHKRVRLFERRKVRA